MEEKLEFAGHPLLGLAYHLHQSHGSNTEPGEWQVALNGREVTLVYIFRQGLMQKNPVTIFQGRFCGRPSEIEALLEFDGSTISNVNVAGNIVDVADIRFSS